MAGKETHLLFVLFGLVFWVGFFVKEKVSPNLAFLLPFLLKKKDFLTVQSDTQDCVAILSEYFNE